MLKIKEIIAKHQNLLTKSKLYRTKILIKHGKKRILNAPIDELKMCQKLINKIFQQILPRPKFLFTSYPKCSMKVLLSLHKHKKISVVVDIADFFKSVSVERIMNFVNFICEEEEMAKQLFKLITVNNRIPTGAPTSGIVAFWACKDVFDEIYKICKIKKYVMTLYADVL